MNIKLLLAAVLTPLICCQSNKTRIPSQDSVPPPALLSQGIEFDFIHTKQNCAVANVNFANTFHKKTFCENIKGNDIKPSTELSGMVKKIIEQLDAALMDPKKSKVSVAYFSFSNKEIQKKFCSLSANGVQIRVFLDNNSGPKPGQPGQIDELIMNNPECLDSEGRLNVKLSYLGGNTKIGDGGIWQLHHNKFLMIESPNQKVKLNFSSGNLSTFGTSLHLDHWVMTNAAPETNFIRSHKCVLHGLEAAVDKSKEPLASGKIIGQSYIQAREKCFDEMNVTPRQSLPNTDDQIEKTLAAEEIAPLFSPNNNRYVEKSFISALGKVPSNGYIYIAIQHFLHPGVSAALTKAAARGVDVRLIMDDDALRGESDVPGVDIMIKKLILIKGIQIRFAETNRQAGGGGALMHNKFAILNGQMTFSGAGHYTHAAMNVNWENFYFTKNKIILLSYKKYFSELWNESVDVEYTLSKGAQKSNEPPILGSDFLKGIE